MHSMYLLGSRAIIQHGWITYWHFISLASMAGIVGPFLTPSALYAQSHTASLSDSSSQSPRVFSLRVAPLGFEQRFKTDIEEGGKLEQRRLHGALRLELEPSDLWQLSLDTSYAYDQYQFSGSSGLGQLAPWEDIHLLSFSAPIIFQASTRWELSLTPFVQMQMENGAEVDDSITGGAFLTVVYRFGEQFHFGLGIGVENRLKDDGVGFIYFPFIRWMITQHLRFVMEVRHPFPVYSLELQYDLGDDWMVSLGLHGDNRRFRLDDNGVAPNGVGQSDHNNLRASLTYHILDDLNLTVYGGVGASHVDLFDESGKRLREDDVDLIPVFGLALNIRF